MLSGAWVRALFAAATLAGLLPAALTAAPWRLADGDAGPPRAVVDNDRGALLAVYREGDRVYLDFSSSAVGGLTRSSCPTFQVDQRTPLHFYALGADCEITGGNARYALTDIVAERTESLVLYRLINGNRITFRYQSLDGRYYESVFSLSQSKQALLGALGRSLSVEAGADE